MVQKIRANTANVFFPNLEGFRFILFLFVYVAHSFIVADNISIKGNIAGDILRAVVNGEAAMTAFFVMSGFLISYLILHEIEETGKFNLKNFYIRRLLRIWPLYYVVIIITVVLFPIFRAHFGEATNLGTHHPIYYFTFLSNFDQIRINFSTTEWLLMQAITWSVSIEEQFYLVWPLIFFFFPKRSFLYLIIAIIVGSLLFRVSNYKNEVVTYHHSIAVFADFAIGGLCGYLAMYSTQFKLFFKHLPKAVIVLAYVAGLLSTTLGPLDSYFIRISNTIFMTFVLLEQIYSDNSFFKFSNNKWATYWGKYTYGLYLLHSIVIWLCNFILLKFFPVLNSASLTFFVIRMVAAFYLSLGVSYLSYQYFEKSFLMLKERFSSTGKKSSVVVNNRSFQPLPAEKAS